MTVICSIQQERKAFHGLLLKYRIGTANNDAMVGTMKLCQRNTPSTTNGRCVTEL